MIQGWIKQINMLFKFSPGMLSSVQIEWVWEPVSKRNTILIKLIFKGTICMNRSIIVY